ncbi:helix-turn-helix transcriptional regulator [Citrobacter sp. S2-9]|uniref:Helix-turn-helix transcriptional regulator n=1 Tax=Citrobacter enshiensis TaxID=2971264 RepID=A0ABT8Q022_9ENTR|nr:helix-turn-helix transcriptional regulator [Citrobacter enshiensis]MDN8601913.1 helix-turn-helix transcriptional regulator [Citrobacter enshiensis]
MMQHPHEGCCKGKGHQHEGCHHEQHQEGCCKGEGHQHEGCHQEHHQEGCGRERHHGHQHGCEHRHGRGGGGRRQRFFGHGELRLVILDILTRDASHGYELIKAIETLTQGNYTPSPGVIYPTLDFLQDQEFISISEEEGGRKKIAITQAGQQWLVENHEQLAHIQERVKARCVGFELRKNPQMKRALDNFKAVLDLRVNQADISEAQIKKIIGVIDRAALDITQLD